MNALIATFIYFSVIAGLFVLVYDRKDRTSAALWLPMVWLLISASRPVSRWLQPGPLQAADMNMDGNPIDRDIYLALMIVGIVVLLGRSTSVGRFLRANPPILIFVAYCAISAVWSDYPDVALKRWLKSAGDVVMILIVLTERAPTTAIKQVFIRVGFVLIPVSVLLIKYYPEMARYYSTYEGTMFVSGVALDKNMLGMTCMVFGLGVWWRLLVAWREERGRSRTRQIIAYTIILGMIFWLFRMADSATSSSCFVMAALLMTAVMVLRVARKPVVVHLLVAGVLGIALSALFLSAAGAVLHAIGRNPTLTGRTEIWREVLNFADNPLFGTGFESFWLGERLRRIWAFGGLLGGINESHDGYLEVYLNLGWIGVTLLAAIILFGYRKIIRAVRQSPQTYCLHLTFFVTALIYNLTEASFKLNSQVWILFLWAIMAALPSVAIKKLSSDSRTEVADWFPQPAPTFGERARIGHLSHGSA